MTALRRVPVSSLPCMTNFPVGGCSFAPPHRPARSLRCSRLEDAPNVAHAHVLFLRALAAGPALISGHVRWHGPWRVHTPLQGDLAWGRVIIHRPSQMKPGALERLPFWDDLNGKYLRGACAPVFAYKMPNIILWKRIVREGGVFINYRVW